MSEFIKVSDEISSLQNPSNRKICSPSSYTLDLGVGKGGRYLERNKTRVIGVDLYKQGLEVTKERYGIDLVQASAFNLPFAKGIFDRIQMYYPHDSILYGLSQANSGVWKEVERVLSPSGRLAVVFDVYPEGYRRIDVGGQVVDLENFRSTIVRAARKSGFAVSVTTVGKNFLFKELGTNYAAHAAQRFREDKNYKNFLLEGAKR